MEILPNGLAVVEGDSHLSKWVKEQGTLKVADGFCRLFTKYIPEGGVVVDIGACLGDHTATYADMVGPNGHVYAFEPNPVAFECLAHNASSIRHITAIPMALGAFCGSAHTKVSPTQFENLGATQLRQGGPITVSTLDREAMFWKRLDFVKIDAEGWEPDILRGGLKTIRKFKPVMLIEVNKPILKANGWDASFIYDFMDHCGYDKFPSEPHLSLDEPQADVLFLPRNHN